MKNELELAIEAIKNREIKFRAWNIPNKTMYYSNTGLFMFVGSGILGWQTGNNWDFPIDDFILMQYTGRKDKHGKEIYAGDIANLEIYYGRPQKTTEQEGICIITFENGSFGYRRINMMEYFYPFTRRQHGSEIDETDYFEIIGNVFETPQLFTDKL